MRSRFTIGSTEHQLHLARAPGGYCLHRGDAEPARIALHPLGNGRATLSVDATRVPIAIAVSGDDVHIHLNGRTYLVRHQDPVRSLERDGAGATEDAARAPMPGTVLAVLVAPGDEVAAGAGLVVIESMKLETTIRAPRAGRVEAVHVQAGQSFERDQALVTLGGAA